MRPAPHFDNQKKCIFETLPNEIKCVLRIKESNFDDKIEQFLHLLLVRAEGCENANCLRLKTCNNLLDTTNILIVCDFGIFGSINQSHTVTLHSKIAPSPSILR